MTAKGTLIGPPAPLPIQEGLVNKAVVDTFDEFLNEISVKTKLHPSEQVGRDTRMLVVNSKIYNYINPYHGFCKLCEQHFYTRSVANDINSFFQKHLNTPYHRQQRSALLFPDDVPIFSWEEPLHYARCNICDLPALKAFVISTKFFVTRLLQQHICVWPRDQRETNEKFVRKLSLLKKYCKLSLFKEKFIKTMNGQDVCLLCGVVVPWSGEKAACHLQSDAHYQKFCRFIWANFNFAPKDILNGFNLETVTRWLITHQFSLWTEYTDYNELAACLKDSNSVDSPYPEEKHNTSFSPAAVEMLLRDNESDFIHINECLLCNVELRPGHFSSAIHQAKAAAVSQTSFQPEKYLLYLQKRKNRLLPYNVIISNYKKLSADLKTEIESSRTEEEGKQTAVPQSSNTAEPQHDSNYFKMLFVKKLALVEQVIANVDSSEIFCHVCDQYLWKSRRAFHLDSDVHKIQVEKWKELRVSFLSHRFLEPFKQIKSAIVCLLCAAVIHANNFFSHLKNSAHARRLEIYCGLNMGVPISEVFKFRDDFSCFCTICNYLLTKKKQFLSLKNVLKEVRRHWPCPEAQEWQKHFTKLEDKAQEGEKSESIVEVEFEKVEKAVEGVVNVFESKITKNVCDRSLFLLKYLENSKLADAKAQICDCQQPSTCTCSVPSSSKDSGEENSKSIKKDMKAEVMETSSSSSSSSKSDEKLKDIDEKETDQVLILKGIPRKKRKYDFIYSAFKSFGEIKFVLIDKKMVIVGFLDRDVAEAAANEAGAVLQEQKINVMVTERKMADRKKNAEETLLSLSQEVTHLLEDPQRLMNFLLQLFHQAVKANDSPVEAKREEKVCNLIVRAAREFFPRCWCYPFGSRLTGLTLNNSDLDVFLDCDGMYEGFKNTTAISEKKIVRTVGKALKKNPEVSDLIVVDSARVPIVSFLHIPTGLHCDISFKSGLSIQNSLLIKFLVSLDWRVKPLILFMKYWAKKNGLHGPPYFSSYALSMLVINYLEQLETPLLPTIDSLQSSYVGRRITIAGWDCSINTNNANILKISNKDPLPVLLAGLFEFYGNFDFAENVVFPLTGKALPRKAFSDEGKNLLPMCYKRHIINVPAPIENLVSDKFPICIVDPFDLSHVLTKSFTFQGLLQFQYLCTVSAQYLKRGMTESSSEQNFL